MSRKSLHRSNRPVRIIVLRDLDTEAVSVTDDGGDFEDSEGDSTRAHRDVRSACADADARFDHYLAENPDAQIVTEMRERRGRMTRTVVQSQTRATVDR